MDGAFVGGEDRKAAAGSFTVTVTKKEVVAAVLPLQEHWLPLSNLDLLLPPLHVGVFFCYKNPKTTPFGDSSSYGAMVGVMKKAMAQVLVTYYAFAGEVVKNSEGEPELLCNNRGVDFYEGFAEVELKDLDFHNPDESVEGKLVPSCKHGGVFAVQATELRCGGLVVGCSFDHRISDAYSANMFLVSWAETAQSKAMSMVPSFRRSLLNPRRPGCIDPSLDDLYVPISALPPPPPKEQPQQPNGTVVDTLISRIYYVTAQELNKIQSMASANGCKRTKLESFSAFLWQMVAKSAIKVANSTVEKSKVLKLGIVVDGRKRLSSSSSSDHQIRDDDKANLMEGYFGNVLSIPYRGKKAQDLVENTLSWVAKEVHEFLKNAITKEHFLGLIDWVEAHRPVSAVSKIYVSNDIDDGPALVVSSGQRFPVSRVNFGWGVPVFGSYHFPWGGSAGYVMPMPSPAGNEDWIVYMHLMKGQLEVIEAEAHKVFRPLTFDYLNLSTYV